MGMSFRIACLLLPPRSMPCDPKRDHDCPIPHMVKDAATVTVGSGPPAPRKIRARTARAPMPPHFAPLAGTNRGSVPAAPVPHKAPPIKIPKRATVGEAFVLIGRSGLAHLHTNEPCVRTRRDSEGIHQLRVSVRRLRSALSLFRATIPDRERRDTARRLKWIAGQCAEAREWDVFQDELVVPLQRSLPDDRVFGDFASEVEKIRLAADARVADMLAGTQYARNILKIETWWIGGGRRGPENNQAAAKAVDFSQRRIRKLHRRLCKHGGRASELDAKGLHRLRIRTKKLRYAIDFFGSLFPGKTAGAYRTALTEIQDILGALNDIAVARPLLAAAKKRAPELSPAVFAHAADVIAEWNAAKRDAGLERLPNSLQRLANLRPF